MPMVSVSKLVELGHATNEPTRPPYVYQHNPSLIFSPLRRSSQRLPKRPNQPHLTESTWHRRML